MPELTKQPYLKVGNYVFLQGRWRAQGNGWLEDKLFKVTKADAFNYYKAYILKQGEGGDIDLKNDISLYPEEYDTLYEIGVALRGNGRLFIKLPSDKSYYYLEKEGIVSTISATTEVGGFTEEMIPPEEPKILREYTIRDMRDTIKYTLVNNSYKDEKMVLDFTVNRVKIAEVTEEEMATIKENWNDLVAKGILRIIRYPKEG